MAPPASTKATRPFRPRRALLLCGSRYVFSSSCVLQAQALIGWARRGRHYSWMRVCRKIGTLRFGGDGLALLYPVAHAPGRSPTAFATSWKRTSSLASFLPLYLP
ncbi:uncharacterized protein SCHCODRAFT_02247238 [Schizophyllum commune H4-8]|uniref:uncharacterized protein n=1 Tax=Schizophyllum commune (strain H4-8 / FGSC 9210) TaxID=578458 RepID=UPI00215FC91F|nr:uncharacterized protein SCHCODRAFT_02247238 [Schizophyllum commune H4-8]KAI5893192.1 hypothetical protein SCHCODRAFT_02247238 [Schizophyllum commune H4-8]